MVKSTVTDRPSGAGGAGDDAGVVLSSSSVAWSSEQAAMGTAGHTGSTAALGEEQAVALLVNGFVRDVLQELPMEFAVEAQKLLEVSLEGSVG